MKNAAVIILMFGIIGTWSYFLWDKKQHNPEYKINVATDEIKRLNGIPEDLRDYNWEALMKEQRDTITSALKQQRYEK